MAKVIKTLYYVFDKHNNGGEQLSLKTEFIHNGDDISEENGSGIFLNQVLTLNSYGNSASFSLNNGELNPKSLRELANSIEETKHLAIQSVINSLNSSVKAQ